MFRARMLCRRPCICPPPIAVSPALFMGLYEYIRVKCVYIHTHEHTHTHKYTKTHTFCLSSPPTTHYYPILALALALSLSLSCSLSFPQTHTNAKPGLSALRNLSVHFCITHKHAHTHTNIYTIELHFPPLPPALSSLLSRSLYVSVSL